MFQLMEFMFPLMFLMFFGVFAVTIIQSIAQWSKNNNSPRLTVEATVITTRTNVSLHRHKNHTHRSTTYYATFQFESGDRLELEVPSSQFGYLVEGDNGKLSFQGTRFLGFERQ